MKSGKKLGLVILAVCGLLFVFFLVSLANHLSYIYPTPENESSFLKSYSPQDVVERFQWKKEGANRGETTEQSAGRKFVRRENIFESRFVIESKDWMPLMLAVDGDLFERLSQQGIEILSHTGDPRGGYHFQYRTGNSFGEIAIDPIKLISVTTVSGPKASLPDDEEAVDLRITIEEKWFKSKPGMITVNISTLSD